MNSFQTLPTYDAEGLSESGSEDEYDDCSVSEANEYSARGILDSSSILSSDDDNYTNDSDDHHQLDMDLNEPSSSRPLNESFRLGGLDDETYIESEALTPGSDDEHDSQSFSVIASNISTMCNSYANDDNRSPNTQSPLDFSLPSPRTSDPESSSSSIPGGGSTPQYTLEDFLKSPTSVTPGPENKFGIDPKLVKKLMSSVAPPAYPFPTSLLTNLRNNSAQVEEDLTTKPLILMVYTEFGPEYTTRLRYSKSLGYLFKTLLNCEVIVCDVHFVSPGVFDFQILGKNEGKVEYPGFTQAAKIFPQANVLGIHLFDPDLTPAYGSRNRKIVKGYFQSFQISVLALSLSNLSYDSGVSKSIRNDLYCSYGMPFREAKDLPPLYSVQEFFDIPDKHFTLDDMYFGRQFPNKKGRRHQAQKNVFMALVKALNMDAQVLQPREDITELSDMKRLGRRRNALYSSRVKTKTKTSSLAGPVWPSVGGAAYVKASAYSIKLAPEDDLSFLQSFWNSIVLTWITVMSSLPKGCTLSNALLVFLSVTAIRFVSSPNSTLSSRVTLFTDSQDLETRGQIPGLGVLHFDWTRNTFFFPKWDSYDYYMTINSPLESEIVEQLQPSYVSIDYLGLSLTVPPERQTSLTNIKVIASNRNKPYEDVTVLEVTAKFGSNEDRCYLDGDDDLTTFQQFKRLYTTYKHYTYGLNVKFAEPREVFCLFSHKYEPEKSKDRRAKFSFHKKHMKKLPFVGDKTHPVSTVSSVIPVPTSVLKPEPETPARSNSPVTGFERLEKTVAGYVSIARESAQNKYENSKQKITEVSVSNLQSSTVNLIEAGVNAIVVGLRFGFGFVAEVAKVVANVVYNFLVQFDESLNENIENMKESVSASGDTLQNGVDILRANLWKSILKVKETGEVGQRIIKGLIKEASASSKEALARFQQRF